MSTIKKIKDLESKLPSILGSLPNVISWAVGKKSVKGVYDFKTVCITVFVKEKKQVDAKDSIPKTIDGIPTDVVVITKSDYHTIDLTPTRCSACFIDQLGIGRGVEGCNVDPACVYTSDENFQPCDCDCVEQRNTDISVTGNNNGKIVVTGGKSASYKIQNNNACNCHGSGGPNIECNACTATLVAKDNEDGNLVLLTAHHCLPLSTDFLRNQNLDVGVPGKLSNEIVYYYELSSATKSIFNNGWTMNSSADVPAAPATPESIGRFKKATWTRSLPYANNRTDVAAFELKLPSNSTDYSIPLPGISQIGDGPFPWITEEQLEELFLEGEPVYLYKSSRSSGTLLPAQETVITNINSTQYIGPSQAEFVGLILALATDNKNQATAGDSGSPVLVNYNNELYVIGLHFAGRLDETSLVSNTYPDLYSRMYTFIIPIWQIQQDLNVSAWDGSIVVNSNDVNITVNGLPFTRTTQTTLPITHKKD
ncbi:MAG TPA: hypothetical protein PKD00_01755 [Burkholderiales bacterium]|nr:hypothetical protein [Burkholderiales bacterium]